MIRIMKDHGSSSSCAPNEIRTRDHWPTCQHSAAELLELILTGHPGHPHMLISIMASRHHSGAFPVTHALTKPMQATLVVVMRVAVKLDFRSRQQDGNA